VIRAGQISHPKASEPDYFLTSRVSHALSMLVVLLDLFYQNLFNDINDIIIKILVYLQDVLFNFSLLFSYCKLW
jgi:hypothetical protein